MSFDVVVAADREWGIGKANALPWPKLKGDLAHFKKITCEASEGRRNAIVMGRKTWESAEVGGRALPRRLNIVITRRGRTPPEGVVVVGSLDAALDAGSREAEATFVVGGAEIFREAFAHPKLRYVYLTRVDGAFACEVKIPDLDALGFARDAWPGELAAEENGVRYRIERLRPPPGT
jgi:dihydrofolate reductase